MPGVPFAGAPHGNPRRNGEIQVIDPETGAPLAAGEVGEIIIRGRGQLQGPTGTSPGHAKTLRTAGCIPGDMGKFDADGYLTFIGRFRNDQRSQATACFPERRWNDSDQSIQPSPGLP